MYYYLINSSIKYLNMKLINDIVCTLLILSNYNAFSTVVVSDPYYYFNLLSSNNIYNGYIDNANELIQIAVDTLLNIYKCLNDFNDINIAIYSFIRNNNIIEYNTLQNNITTASIQDTNNFVSLLSSYGISIGNTINIYAVCDELSNKHFRNSLNYNDFTKANTILDVSLRRVNDRIQEMRNNLWIISSMPYINKNQLFNYLMSRFSNIINNIHNAISDLNAYLNYLRSNFDYHHNSTVVQINKKLQQIIISVLDFLHCEDECLRKLQYY